MTTYPENPELKETTLEKSQKSILHGFLSGKENLSLQLK
jgi:hypothetical protein